MQELKHDNIVSTLEKMIIKKLIGEGESLNYIIDEYGYLKFLKILISIIKSEKENKTKTQFYEKCKAILLELEDESKEIYPELWV